MPKSSPLLNDLLTLGGNLLGNFAEVRHDAKAQAKTHLESIVRKLDLVSREEFDAAFAMLSKARMVQDDLTERLDRIEAHLGLSRVPKNKNAKKTRLPSVKQGKNRKIKK